MTEPRDPVTEADIDAYVDDQLSQLRRIEVEAHLADNPALAARAMADLRIRDELRLALAGRRAPGRPETTEAARRLGRGLARDRLARGLTRIAAAVTLVGLGWLGHAGIRPTQVSASQPFPAYVSEAVSAHAASQVRAAMPSQPKSPQYDRREIRSATGIAMPALPAGWQVRDTQIFPSANGPSVEVALGAGTLGAVSLFAVRPGCFDVVQPAAGPAGTATSAYFQIGETAYVLVAGPDLTGDTLRDAASDLAQTLR